ncbi:MAG TPA: tRNA lysidine(34) synthetase TilS [Ohtaekwangia sp.]|uniref:tRNA lysidine(34) synthetase TilS n=1 Tax=Ohtaekwangia sp. TaxID=2066019 RepID=UPI002F932C2D
MLEQFLNHIHQHTLCRKDDCILLAVSGGIDSMVMLHLFQQAGFSIAIAHCNFQLRGKDADGDEDFVKTVAAQQNIPCFTTRFDTAAYAEVHKLSIQMAARELRYRWFNEVVTHQGFTKLATAHHLNDSLETVLLHWVHGASLDGFAGIPVKHSNIIRPLLFASREAIEQYAKAHNIAWREDSSNQTDDYQRNYIRHKIIPALKELNPSLEYTIQRSFGKVAGELALLHRGLEAWTDQYVTVLHDRIMIDKAYFQGATHEASVLWNFLKEYGFNYDVCMDIVASLHGQSGKRFYSSTHQLVNDREHLLVTKQVNDWENARIEKDQQQATFGIWNMTILPSAVVQKSSQVYEATLDAAKIIFPLVWRKWKAGDAFYPLGMQHRKKVSDFLIDNKVSVADKDTVTVLESQGEIIWVAGHRIDNRYRITETTREVITFRVSPHFPQ